jgi:hypothetical protein
METRHSRGKVVITLDCSTSCAVSSASFAYGKCMAWGSAAGDLPAAISVRRRSAAPPDPA